MSEDSKKSEEEETLEEVSTSSIEEKYGFAKGDTPDFKWYIAKTMTGQENKVVKTLKERVVNLKLTEFFADILTPEEEVTTNVGGKKRRLKKKFFPGYILIKMIMNESSWHLVKNTDKITGFIGGTSDKPAPISDDEAAYMTNQADGRLKRVKSSIDFTEGETVKVIEGPFTSFVGTVESVNEKGKLKVSVSIFGRPTPVELEFSQVEKMS
ncbi:MAG: transcription termination/antitermination protein NusG [Epsilonproteobacteria bacterium]|nr:MAG: transcription termination/antitermination protein NusG [Campylobacterota bacterium]RLA66526.1 MAG: transcription termination/antitermination protein NusG [Campylobacterota bacterium]